MAEKPSLDATGAAAQLNRSGGSWSQELGQSTSVTFGFRPDAPNYNPGHEADYVRLEEPQIVIALLSFQSWSDVANITFNRVGSGTSGDAAYTEQATILLGGFNNGPDIGAFTYTPGQNGNPGNRSFFNPEGDAYFNLERSNIQDPDILNRGMRVFTHELGHAIGLDHAGDYAAGEGETITYEQHAEYREDTSQYTVMSYFDESKTGANYGDLSPGAPQLHDIAAAQRLYGANMETRTGATMYGFGSTADRPWFSIASASAPVIFCAWDAGGRDTFNFSGYAQNQLIDLGEGRFSNVGALTGNVSIAFGAVIEDAIGGSGSDQITGNAAGNALSGNAGNDSLSGLEGSDTLKGGVGADTLDGGAGVDTASFVGSPAVTASLASQSATGDGADVLIGIESMIGSDLGDALTGSSASNTLQGGKGADSLDGGAGDDRLDGGEGSDTLRFTGSGPAVVVNLAAGTASGRGADTLIAIENVIGTGGADALTGSAAANRLQGGAGADTLDGGAGDDVLEGGEGIDVVRFAGAGAGVVVNLATGLAAGRGDDDLGSIESAIGTDEADDMTGSEAVNTLSGGEGDDSLDGGGGDDLLDGADGSDTARFTGAGAGVRVDLAAGTAMGRGADTLISVENVVATGAADTLNGSAGANGLHGGGGDDLIDGGTGDDLLDGGDGLDTVVFAGASGGVVVNLLAGLAGGRGDDQLASIENAVGTGFADTLLGGAVANRLDGGGGDDLVDGGKGADTLNGGAGVDTARFAGKDAVMADLALGTAAGAGADVITGFENLLGGSGDDSLAGNNGANDLAGSKGEDTLSGAGGSDRLTGGKGADQLQGGSGVDTLVFTRLADSRGGAGADLVLGLSNADVIDLSAIDADKNAAGNQAFVLIDAFTRDAGQLVLRSNAASGETLLVGDVDGDGRADLTIRISGDHAGFSSFVL